MGSHAPDLSEGIETIDTSISDALFRRVPKGRVALLLVVATRTVEAFQRVKILTVMQ